MKSQHEYFIIIFTLIRLQVDLMACRDGTEQKQFDYRSNGGIKHT